MFLISRLIARIRWLVLWKIVAEAGMDVDRAVRWMLNLGMIVVGSFVCLGYSWQLILDTSVGNFRMSVRNFGG